jgi:hypothetical protein
MDAKEKRPYRKWMASEIEAIRKMYPTTSTAKIAMKLGTTPGQVTKLIRTHNITKHLN